MKIPKGIIKDVLIKVDAFHFPVDFVVLDTKSALNANIQIHVIFGSPFLSDIQCFNQLSEWCNEDFFWKHVC